MYICNTLIHFWLIEFVKPDPVEPICDPKLEFHCKSGECIDSAKQCNGKEDCGDGSDESTRICGN